MKNGLDSIFWAYFDEYIKKDISSIFKKINNDLKKVNEIYEVTYYALFQIQLLRNESLVNIEPEKFKKYSTYILDNYNELFLFTFKTKIQNQNLKN